MSGKKDIKKLFCSLGIPIVIIDRKNNIEAKIYLNERNDICLDYYKLRDKEWPKGEGMYLCDANEQTIKNCVPKNPFKRLGFYVKKILT